MQQDLILTGSLNWLSHKTVATALHSWFPWTVTTTGREIVCKIEQPFNATILQQDYSPDWPHRNSILIPELSPLVLYFKICTVWFGKQLTSVHEITCHLIYVGTSVSLYFTLITLAQINRGSGQAYKHCEFRFNKDKISKVYSNSCCVYILKCSYV